MKKFIALTFLSILTLFLMTSASKTAIAANNSANLLNIETKYGKIVIELMPQVAPKHVERINFDGFCICSIKHNCIFCVIVQQQNTSVIITHSKPICIFYTCIRVSWQHIGKRNRIICCCLSILASKTYHIF